MLLPSTPTSVTASTPTPRKSRRRDFIRQSRAMNQAQHLGTTAEGDNLSVLTASPAPSTRSTSTVARSRNSTPQHRRIRKSSAGTQAVPVHRDPPVSNSTAVLLVPNNTPPPPYEISPDSPFRVFQCQDNAFMTPMTDSLAIEEIRAMDCGCPGACGCTNNDPISAAFEPSVQEFHFASTVEPASPSPRPDSAVGYLLSCSDELQTPSNDDDPHLSALPDQQRTMTSFFTSVDRLTPAIRKLKEFPWNKSV